jgi:MFS family permease
VTTIGGQAPAVAAREALRLVVLLGLVSLFADMTYEGARSVTGPFLAILGASGTAVGIVAGAGELAGYGLRLVSGYLSDRTGRYWTITLLGYGVNLLAVPLLAVSGRWETAGALMIAERVGKAIRTPPRDAMLSHATTRTGIGWGFGLHEALDQLGAVLGPLLVAAVLALRGDYRAGFAALLVPAALALALLGVARRLYPRPRDLEVETVGHLGDGFPREFWQYLAAAACIAAGYVDFPLIAYHFGKAGLAPERWIPLAYALAMGVDGLAALTFGRLFDRHGIAALVLATVLSAAFPLLVFTGSFSLARLGMVLWGIGMGAQESILRGAVAKMVPPAHRASAYGVFNTGYGLAWFAGSALMGLLYDVSLAGLIAFSVALQLAAVPLLLGTHRQLRRPAHP